MLLEEVYKAIPKDWSYMDYSRERYKIVELSPFSPEYHDVANKIFGNYYACINGIYRIQNPHIYTKFSLKCYEYDQRGATNIMTLFHDSPFENTLSIAEYNFDWRYGTRYMYGPGVYFSVSPSLARKHSNNNGSLLRCMYVADVLVQKVQEVKGDIFLPDFGYDTVLAHNNLTYVKYFDCEYYPRYFAEYVSLR